MTGALSTAPNSAIPAGLRDRAYDEDALGKANGHAAGILFVAPDGDVLLLKRAGKPGQDNFVDHWALPGGGAEDGETPEQTAAREAREEMGLEVDPATLRDLDKVVTPTGLAFHTFASKADKKFGPTLNDEHLGYGWFSLDKLPPLIHPAVKTMIDGRIGSEQGARDGFLAWLDGKGDDVEGATDSALSMALDRETVREKTRDGRLVVKKSNITKACVSPYRGKEIPGWQQLGLDPDKIYNLLRDPEELRKATPTLNGVQLLIKHTPVSARDHKPNETVGSLGTDAAFDGEYLTNSLFVNAQKAIDLIEDDEQKELSAGYHYKPDMTPGIFRGTRFDGVMRDIVFNHVALVKDGRAGPDVVVGDEALKEIEMAKPTRFAALLLASTAAHIAPLLAMDSKVTLPADAFGEITPKNLKEKKTALISAVRSVVDGKLRQGLALDASMTGLAKAIDAFEELDKEVEKKDIDEAADVDPIAGTETTTTATTTPATTFDAEPLKAFLREKGMGEDDVSKVLGMMPKNDVAAQDEDDEDDKKKDDDKVTKQAMDEAIKSATELVRKNEREIRVALAEVKPYVGDLPATLAFDSAADVLRHGLTMLGVKEAKTLHADALLPILKAQKLPGAKTEQPRARLAMDSKTVDRATEIAPGIGNILTVT